MHTANILGYDATANDDVQVFRGTIQAVLKSQFPTINPSMVQVEEITLSHVNEQLIRGAKSCAVNTTISPQIPLLAASDNRWADTVEELQMKIGKWALRLIRLFADKNRSPYIPKPFRNWFYSDNFEVIKKGLRIKI